MLVLGPGHRSRFLFPLSSEFSSICLYQAPIQYDDLLSDEVSTGLFVLLVLQAISALNLMDSSDSDCSQELEFESSEDEPEVNSSSSVYQIYTFQV